ncbi:MAG TPA: GNAT family N-acetyltransferase [Rugosimonospora sp.]|nr:GNAT family N-acetyltransferase [Rugosimonospora sp.]
MRIDDGDLILRPWEPGDAPAVYRAAQDPLIPRYTTLSSPYLMSHAEKFVGQVAPAGWAAGTSANFAVLDAATGELLGSCGLVWIRDGVAELGYWTAAAARGRGVALRASRLVCGYAFSERAIERIGWQAEIGNQASRLVALRAGFEIGGTTQFVHPNPAGLPLGWVGTLLPSQLTLQTPEKYAPGSAVARRARVLGAPQPILDLPDGLGRLRALDERDLDAVTAACQHPEIARWTTVPDPYRREDAESFVAQRRRAWALGTAVTYAIVDPGDAWLGNIDLRLDRVDGLDAEVGYLVARHAWGRGYASAALGTLSAWAFDTLGLERIRWRARVGNDASRAVARRCGFQEEGVERAALPRRDGAGRWDARVGSLLASDPR